MKRFVVAIIGGAVLWAAFDPVHLAFLSFIGVAIYGYVSRGRGSFFLGFVTGLAFFLPLTEWARISVGQVLPWIALAVLQALFFGLGAVILRRIWQLSWLTVWQVLASGLTFTCIELFRSSWPWGGFPWGSLAFAQVGTPLLRLAPYLGSVGVTFVAATLGFALLAAWDKRRDLVTSLGTTLAVITAIVLPIVIPLPKAQTTWVSVGWVQGGSGPADASTRALGVTQAHLAETKRLLESGSPDLIVWPESASDHDIRTHEPARALVEEAVETAGVPILLGTQEYLEKGRYNDVVVVDETGIVDRYSKSRPVPFGEYIPHREFFRNFTSAVDLVRTDMIAGQGPAIVDVPSLGLRLATPICFEVAIDAVVRDGVVAGGQALIVPVNTASFGESAESMQQLRQTIFRAVEYSRGAIQVATQGVSAVVQPNGVVTDQSTMWEASSGITRLPLRDVLTPAAKFGPIYEVIVISAGTVMAAVALFWKKRKDSDEGDRHRTHVQRNRNSSRPSGRTARSSRH